MAIHRGIQSALFWYLSCAPCSEARANKERKRELVRGRADREAMYAELGPNTYRQASPRSTNPHWQTEITAGPALVSRGGKKKNNNSSNNNKNNNNTTNSSTGRRELKRSITQMTQRSDDRNMRSSADVSSMASMDGRVDDKVYFQQFQRDDDPWASNVSTDRMASSSTLDGSVGSGITRPPKAKLRGPDVERSFGSERNPMINDLHPATVTRVNSREEARFLMAAQPHADFMSGKEASSPRSRSDSGASRMSSRSGVPLTREISRKIIEQKIRNGEAPLSPSLPRESPIQLAADANGQRPDGSSRDEVDFPALEELPAGRSRKRTLSIPIQVSEDSTDSISTVIRNPDAVPEPIRARKVASRPQLSTIASDSLLPEDVEDERDIFTAMPAKENIRHSDDSNSRDRMARRSAVQLREDTLKACQDLAPSPQVLKTQLVTSRDLDGAAKRSMHTTGSRRASQDSAIEDEDRAEGEMFDSWYTPDFVLPEWIHEHTKREVSQRWSMDI